MAVSDIITGQFVCIEQTPASAGDRIAARVIDFIAVTACSFLVFVILNLVSETKLVPDNTLWRVACVLWLPVIAYTFVCELLFNGQTIGKCAMGIRVVMADGSAPTAGALLLRFVCEIVDIWVCGVGLVFIICTKHHQRLGDMAAGTMVIRRPGRSARVRLDEFAYARRGYVVTYAEASRLSPRQAGIVEHALLSARGGSKNVERLGRLAAKVASVLGVKPASDGRAFLTTVLGDYKHVRGLE